MRLGLVAAAVLLVACGGDDAPRTIYTGDILADLKALPGVASVEQMDTATSGYSYYVLQFEQPVDHDAPDGQTFHQKVSLLHRDIEAPMVAWTSGYWDYYNDHAVELTGLLDANQISIEHRYFDASRPEPADWSQLTIEQMAADEHAIISTLRTLYPGAFITSGASKGGMTAIYHRRFYPDDVDGTVPYVAPISFGAPDTRYNPFLDTLGPAACRQAIRDVAVEMLANRRAALTTFATDQATAAGLQYTRIALDPAVESAVFNLEWAFWQYYGVGFCPDVPATTATDDELWQFLDDISPVADNADDRVAQFDAYYYQAYYQLGYPEGGAHYLDAYLMFDDADYLGALPTDKPAYDGGAAMMDIDSWLQSDGEGFAFIYGQWDPWTGGAFQLGDATDSVLAVQPEGTHGARITRLAPGDRDTVLGKLAAWTGVTPDAAGMARARLAPERGGGGERWEPRMPPGLIRALSSRRQ